MVRILLVEDDRDLREEVADFLRGEGHVVREAGSRQEFRALMAEEPCDIALLDRRLPDGVGLDLIGEGQRNLVVSMKDVTLISSSGLRALVTAQIKLRRVVPRGDVVLSELPPLVRESMELVGFEHMFQIFDGDLDAVGSF